VTASRRASLLLPLCVCSALVPVAGFASNQDLMGYGTRGPALGGAVTARTRGFECVYYNPAALMAADPLSEDASAPPTHGGTFAAGYQWARYALTLRHHFPRDAESQALAERVTHPDAANGLHAGASLVLPFRGVLQHRVALAMGLYVPEDVIVRARLPRPYTPSFTLVADRSRVVAVQAGGAVRLWPWLRVGASVRALASLYGAIEVAPNAVGTLGSRVQDQLVAEYSGVYAMHVTPSRGWEVGLVWRDPFVARFELPIRTDLGPKFRATLPVDMPVLQIAGTAQYDPGQLALGVARRVGALGLEVGVLWKRWSPFPNPVDNTTLGVPPQPAPGFHDTISPKIGAEWTLPLGGALALDLRAGYGYEPTPVPEQTGATNFLDGSRHVMATGVEGRWTAGGAEVAASLGAQWHLMPMRTHTKAAPGTRAEAAMLLGNLGAPDIGGGGAIFSLVVGAEVRY